MEVDVWLHIDSGEGDEEKKTNKQKHKQTISADYTITEMNQITHANYTAGPHLQICWREGVVLHTHCSARR